MSGRLDRKYGNMGLRDYGYGVQLQSMPKVDKVRISDFSGGYDAVDSREDVPRNTTPYAIDMEVSERDEIIRSPGVRTAETFDTRTPNQLVLHADVDAGANLLLFDAPYLGVFDGTSTVWTDHSLAAGSGYYAWTNFGGDILFSPGDTALYKRTAAGVISTIVGGFPAKALATFLGRAWAANTDDGTHNPMGVAWTGTAGTGEDWSGGNSGNELLISNSLEVDYIQSLIPIGFDIMVIVCRRSVWVATRTGQSTRPANFEPRLSGEGAINNRVSAATPYGVVFLGDEGVRLFDGSTLQPIGAPIDPDLSIDYDQLDDYVLYYHQRLDRVYVHTPTDTWIYDFRRTRWYRRSLMVLSASAFGQVDDAYEMYFLGVDQADRVVLGYEDHTLARYFDRNPTPIWEFPLEKAEYEDQLVSTTRLLVSYLGEGTLDFWQPNIDGDFERVGGVTLSPTSGTKPRMVPVTYMHTGLNLGMQFRVVSGRPRVTALGLEIVLRGPRIPAAVVRPETLVAVYVAAGDYWIFLPYDEVEGLTTGGFDEGAGDYLLLNTGDADKVLRRIDGDYVTINDI